jgi:hypothetical protein
VIDHPVEIGVGIEFGPLERIATRISRSLCNFGESTGIPKYFAASNPIHNCYQIIAGSAISDTASECSAGTVGLTLADGKRTLAGLRDHVVWAQSEE